MKRDIVKEQSLNKHLVLTPEAEIRRLNAVIEQKNKIMVETIYERFRKIKEVMGDVGDTKGKG